MYGDKFTDWLSTQQFTKLANVSSSYLTQHKEDLPKILLVGNRKFYDRNGSIEFAKKLNPDWERQLRHIDSENHQNFNGLLIGDWTTHTDSKWGKTISRQRFNQIANYPNIQRIKWGSTWVYNKEDLERHFNTSESLDYRSRRTL